MTKSVRGRGRVEVTGLVARSYSERRPLSSFFWCDEGVFAGARNSKTLVFRPPRAPCGRASACIPATN